MNIKERTQDKPKMLASTQQIHPVEFSLTYQQSLVIQNTLPKRFALIKLKNINNGTVISSAAKSPQEEIFYDQSCVKQNDNVDNTSSLDSHNKPIKIKKIDKVLDLEPQRTRKPAKMSEFWTHNQLAQCRNMLNLLKKHKNAHPFLYPVDAQREGVPHYYQIIKQPMDLSTVQANLDDGIYYRPEEFHFHILKIWTNGYHFNEIDSYVYKCTVAMERYYRMLLNNDRYKKSMKAEKLRIKGGKEKTKKEMTQVKNYLKRNLFTGQFGTGFDFDQQH